MFKVGDVVVSKKKIVSRIDPDDYVWDGHLGSITQIIEEDDHKEYTVKFKDHYGCFDLFDDEVHEQIGLTNTVWIIIMGSDDGGGIAVWPEEVASDDAKGNCFPTREAAMVYLETSYGK